MNLPLVDPFAAGPYQLWSMRRKTQEELAADYAATGRIMLDTRDQLLEEVRSPLEAARYMAREGADMALGHFINDALSKSAAHAAWRDAMPPRTPPAIAKYQREFPYYDAAAVDAAIAAFGVHLPVDQILFHGGLWMGGASNTFTTTLPLSTTLCPQVALREADHLGKAYNAGQIHLLVLRIAQPSTKAFVFRRNGTSLGHENEVLFASGLRLHRGRQVCVRNDYLVKNLELRERRIPLRLVDVALT